MVKRFLIIAIFLSSIFSVFSTTKESTTFKESTTLKENDDSLRKKADYFMKFRGSTSIIFAYYPAVHDGVLTGVNQGSAGYTPLDYTGVNDPHHSVGQTGRKIGSTWGGLEVGTYASFSMSAPFLTADNPLMKNNNIKMTLLWELSPVSLEAGASITWEPIAFFLIESGFKIGSGWQFPGIANGIGKNIDGVIQKEPFAGAHLSIWFKPQPQMDIAALMPEKLQRWTHIVLVAAPIFEYRAILNFRETEAWEFKNDGGKNYNGWKFKSLFILGYKIPVLIDDKGSNRSFVKVYHNNFDITIGGLLQIDYLELSNYSISPMKNSSGKRGWGSDFAYVEFGPIMNFDLPNNYFVNLFFFFKNAPGFTDETVGNLDFKLREYEDWYIYFRRIVFEFGWKF